MKARYLDIFREIEEDHKQGKGSSKNSHLLVIDGLNTFIRVFSAVPALKRLGDDIVVVRGVRAAEGAAVHPAFARRGGSDAGGEKTWVVSAC